jgi:outer membrane lipoprotein-sorting protein
MIFAWLMPATLLSASTDSLNVKDIIQEIDELYRATASYAEIEMEITNPHWQRTMTMKVWSLGRDRTFVRILTPKKERGVGSLRVKSEMWNYLPKTDKVIKIPPSMMMSSWMGSDFTNDDLVKEFSLWGDYSYELITPDDAEDSLVYVNCIPQPDLPIIWANIVIAARRSDHLPVWQKYYDDKGRMMRLMTYSDIQTFDGRRLPATLEMIPQNKDGHKTVIRYNKLSFDARISDDLFSLQHLRSPE